MMSDASIRISSFKSPTAFVSAAARSELLQTSSAKYAVLCAGVVSVGRISKSRTGNPISASCHAASLPASPAPMTVIVSIDTIVSFISSSYHPSF